MASPFPFTSGQVLTAAQLNGIGEVTAFTPSWTNLTPGNATETWYYTRVQRLVYVYGDTTFGSTTSIGGSVSLSVPVGTIAGVGAVVGTPIGRVRCTSIAVGPLFVMGIVQIQGSTTVSFQAEEVGTTFVERGGGISTSYPFTWATGDRINAFFTYQIA